MVNIAVMGYGVVGSGVVEVIRKNRRDLFTKNPDEIFDDPSIGIVVETIGGIGAAYEFTKKALGKNVVTSNKELVATHGPE